MTTNGSLIVPALKSARSESSYSPARALDSCPERAVPSLVLAAAAALLAAFPGARELVAPAPFLIALVLCGLPHGAADGALLIRSAGRGALPLALGYLLLMIGAGLAFFFFPTPTILAFLALAWLHFGSADVEEAMSPESARWRRAAWGLCRGGVVVGIPFAVNPERAWLPFARLAELLGAGAVPVPPTWLSVGGAVIATVAALALFAAWIPVWAAGDRQPGGWDFGETILIAGVALVADPLFAVGAYFLLVHGLKQSAAVGRELTDRPALRSRLARLHVVALPLLIPSWLALGVTAFITSAATAYDLAALSLGLYIVTTPPHEILQRFRGTPPEIQGRASSRRT